jgi:glutamate---cysteine ligase / carboxylate-amine ligase
MKCRPEFHLFDCFGVELEYMIVDAQSLAVLPVTDRVLWTVAGEYLSEIELGSVSWSNELALHVIELKTTKPASNLEGLVAEFQENVGRINQILAPLGGRLMPTAMHPWMDPHREMRLWPHEHSPIYETLHRVFDCRGHGWANLQSVHLNLPFVGDQEFARLHAAIRLLLPIMPALAASSPVMDGRITGRLDNRLEVYRHNARQIPRVSGAVIPEPVFSEKAYQQEILQPL